MGDIGDYLKKKALDLNLDRADTLSQIQLWLDKEYSGQARAVSLNSGILKIITPNASLASELQMRRPEIQKIFESEIASVRVRITTL